MPPVRRSEERRFMDGLKKLFKPIIDAIQNDSGILHGSAQKERRWMHSGPINRFLENLVGRMVKGQRKKSANSWKEAAALANNGPELHRMIRDEMKGPVGTRVAELISENAAYIKTLPDLWARYVTEYAYREGLKGKRPEDIEAELRGILPQHITKNLKCIARTECAKANAAIVEARAEYCGIRAYIWRCVRDERSRDSHIGMDGVLVFYNDPPNPEALFPGNGKPYGNYHAGNTFNCRCYQEPVIDDDFLPDSIRVHDHGEIRTMTKEQIRRTYGKLAG